MKEKIKEIICNVMYAMILVFSAIAMVSGVVSVMWHATQFNYPLLIHIVSVMLTLLLFRWL